MSKPRLSRMKRPDYPATEQAWWDAFGGVQERVWVYDAYFERAVRRGYLAELSRFLFKPGGRVLDFGCGTGWVGLRLAERGMRLEGVDISAEQLKLAKKEARARGVTRANFAQTGAALAVKNGAYDSIIVHSLFHHLSDTDKQRLLQNIADKLIEGGRAYFYEPLAARPGPGVAGRILNKGILGFFWLLRKMVYWLHLQEADIRQAIEAGWTMQSPAEAPLDLDAFTAFLPPDLKIVKVAWWHMAAVAYANLGMGLKPFWRRAARPMICLFQAIDRVLLSPRYRHYMHGWPMASIMLVKESLCFDDER